MEALAATRRLRLAETTLAQVNECAAVLRERSRLTKGGVMTIYRTAAEVARLKAVALSVISRLRSGETDLAEANRWVALLMAIEDAEAVVDGVFPEGYEIYDGYLHFNGVCTGVIAD